MQRQSLLPLSSTETPRFAAAVILAAVLLLAAFNTLYRLNDEAIRDWDEARHGVSAMEMIQSGHYVVNTFAGAPDYWNTKPTLSFLPMILGFKAFGFTPFGLRFFSAFSVIILAGLMVLFCRQRLLPATGLLSAVILLTSKTFVIRHGARTGDPEAFYALLYTAAIFIVLWDERRMYRYYLAAFVASLAFLTKSFHAGALGFTLALFFLMDFGLTRRSLAHALGCLVCAALPIALWAYLRYQFDGTLFFEHMLGQDLVERATTGMEGHAHGPGYYFGVLWQGFDFWLIALLCCLILVTLSSARRPVFAPRLKQRVIFKLAVAVALPLLLFSLSASKLKWYLYCVYPLIAILLAHLLMEGIRTFTRRELSIAVLLVVLLFAGGEIQIIKTLNKRAKGDYAEKYMREAGKDPELRGQKLYLAGKEWSQRYLLASRMFGPFTLMPGGEEAFNASGDTNAVLLKKPGKEERKDDQD